MSSPPYEVPAKLTAYLLSNAWQEYRVPVVSRATVSDHASDRQGIDSASVLALFETLSSEDASLAGVGIQRQ